MSNLPTEVQFNDLALPLHHHHGQVWLTAESIGVALGMQYPSKAINTLYLRNQDEFTELEVRHLDLRSPGGIQQTRVFSPRGARLIGFLAKTDAAKAFRRWVLDVLEQLQTAPALPQAAVKALDTVYPTWPAIRRYRAMGLTLAEVATLVKLGQETVRKQLRAMEELGIIAVPAHVKARRLAWGNNLRKAGY